VSFQPDQPLFKQISPICCGRICRKYIGDSGETTETAQERIGKIHFFGLSLWALASGLSSHGGGQAGRNWGGRVGLMCRSHGAA
tara:strand:- start:4958 stop:5209 length:252 start_codon:yes stop_codon:yes gene_type:complete